MSDLLQAVIGRRKRLGLSQAAVARRAGLTTSQVSRIESGAATPKLDSLEAMADALGVALVLVPVERLTEVRRIVGGHFAVVDPGSGSAFQDVFIPDPDDQNG